MSTQTALIAAIAANPAEDTPRLVYADFLDEQGGESNSARASFIRAQVELARPGKAGDRERRKGLRERVKQLHREFAKAWSEPIYDLAGTNKYAREAAISAWNRGFLNWITFGSVAAFVRNEAKIAALTPLTNAHFNEFNDKDVSALVGMPEVSNLRGLTLFGSVGGRNAKNVGDATARAMAESAYLSNLELLDLTQNRLTTKGVKALANSPRLPLLKTLHLYGNELNDETYRVLVASSLGKRMTDWDVTGSSLITSTAARVIAETPTLTQITNLSFSNTDIGDDGVEALAAAEHLSSVRVLDFRCTELTSRGVKAIARSPIFANLRELSFVKTWIDGFGARYLRESPYLKKIKLLALYDCVPEASQKKLKERFGRKVDFGRR